MHWKWIKGILNLVDNMQNHFCAVRPNAVWTPDMGAVEYECSTDYNFHEAMVTVDSHMLEFISGNEAACRYLPENYLPLSFKSNPSDILLRQSVTSTLPPPPQCCWRKHKNMGGLVVLLSRNCGYSIFGQNLMERHTNDTWHLIQIYKELQSESPRFVIILAIKMINNPHVKAVKLSFLLGKTEFVQTSK